MWKTFEEKENIMNRICDLARSQETAKLQAYLDKEGVTINFTLKGSEPIQRLFKHGDLRAVFYLLNVFNAFPDRLMSDAAFTNNKELVTRLSQLYETYTASFISGYAKAGNQAETNKWVHRAKDKRFAEQLKAAGYGYSGQKKLQVTIPKADRAMLLLGMAKGGYSVEVFCRIFKFQWRKCSIKLELALGCIHMFAAEGQTGDVMRVLMYPDYLNRASRFALINQALEGYATNGFEKEVNELLAYAKRFKGYKQYIKYESIAFWYLYAGMYKLSQKLAKKYGVRNNKYEISAYAKVFDMFHLEKIISDYRMNQSIIAKRCVDDWHEHSSVILRMMSFTRDSSLRMELYKEYLKKCPNVAGHELMFVKASEINALMANYKLDYEQALILFSIRFAANEKILDTAYKDKIFRSYAKIELKVQPKPFILEVLTRSLFNKYYPSPNELIKQLTEYLHNTCTPEQLITFIREKLKKPSYLLSATLCAMEEIRNKGCFMFHSKASANQQTLMTFYRELYKKQIDTLVIFSISEETLPFMIKEICAKPDIKKLRFAGLDLNNLSPEGLALFTTLWDLPNINFIDLDDFNTNHYPALSAAICKSKVSTSATLISFTPPTSIRYSLLGAVSFFSTKGEMSTGRENSCVKQNMRFSLLMQDANQGLF